MNEQSPNHLPDENKLPQMEKRRGHAQICSASQASAHRGLPVFNECGTTRRTLDVFDRHEKPFQSWNMFTGCITREGSAPCNATMMSTAIFQLHGCNFVCNRPIQDMFFNLSQKERNASSRKSWPFLFSPDRLLILLVAAQHMFRDCSNQIESLNVCLVAVRNA